MILKLSKSASGDLEEICRYGLENFGEIQTVKYIENIEDRLNLICGNPEIGRLDTRISPAIRRFEVRNHVVFYDVTDGYVFIVRILKKSIDFVGVFGGN